MPEPETVGSPAGPRGGRRLGFALAKPSVRAAERGRTSRRRSSDMPRECRSKEASELKMATELNGALGEGRSDWRWGN